MIPDLLSLTECFFSKAVFPSCLTVFVTTQDLNSANTKMLYRECSCANSDGSERVSMIKDETAGQGTAG